MTDSLAAVEQLLLHREVLRRPHARLWPAIARCEPALLRRWADATMALSRVNAGPACIVAFWQAANHPALALALSGGEAAAELCRLAGAKAALACLEALPAAIRLTGSSPAALAAWWQGLQRLAHDAPALVHGVAQRTETLLGGGSGPDFADFVAAGLKATSRDKARRAAFFTLQDPMARDLLARRAGTPGFAECERMLAAYAGGLWGGQPRMAAGPPGAQRTMIASGTVLFPERVAGMPAAAARDLYRAASAHAQAHLAVPAVCHPLLQLKPMQLALIGLIEDARVETLAIRRYPGLRRLWANVHTAQPGGRRTAEALMARLARALLDLDYADGDAFVQKGVSLFQNASAQLHDPSISRTIGGLLGNDFGQMRVQFNARSYAVEPPYRDDNMHLWDLPDIPDDALSLTIDMGRPQPGDAGGDNGPANASPAPRARDAGMDDRAAVLATYPEWDRAAGVERPDWTTLRDAVPMLRPPAPAGEAALRAQLARLVRSSFVGQFERQARREDGETLDLDAAIDALVARRRSAPVDDRVYRDRNPRGRSLSTLIILDVSQSTAARDHTGRTVLDTQRLAVAALAPPLEARGDAFALRAFASAGRDDVRLTRIKDFAEKLSPAVHARLAGLSPGFSTRLGAALRHAGAELAPLRTTRKLVLVLTDGEPSDIDVPDPRELVEDARRAVLGLRRRGIDVFGLMMDPHETGSAADIFGQSNTMPIRRLEDLPTRLAGIYFRLSRR